MRTLRSTRGKRADRTAAADDVLSIERMRNLSDVFGRSLLAEFVGVNTSQLSRWVRAEQHPGPRDALLLIDLDHVLARAQLVWSKRSALTWLESGNSHLGGGRPIDVLRTSGPAHVLEALDAESWGGAT